MEKFPIPAPAFSGDGRRVDVGAGFDWLRQGWALFIAYPGQWAIMAMLLMILMLAGVAAALRIVDIRRMGN